MRICTFSIKSGLELNIPLFSWSPFFMASTTGIPDITLPNHQHLFQTAEGLRNAGHPEWMQVTGLIHDLGKILYERGCDEDGTSMDTQWGIVGDTYVLGCKIPDTIVYNEFNELSKDKKNKNFSTKLGTYKPNIGLDNLIFTFGHDEFFKYV